MAYNRLTRWIGHRLGRAPRFHANRDEFGIVAHNARDRSTVGKWLALRPEFSTQARMPPTAFLAPRGVRRGLPVLTAGLVPDSCRRYPTGPVAFSLSNARGPWPSSFRAIPMEGREGSKMTTRTEHNRAVRRRAELTRDRGPRGLEPAIDTRRRVNSRRADGTWTGAERAPVRASSGPRT